MKRLLSGFLFCVLFSGNLYAENYQPVWFVSSEEKDATESSIGETPMVQVAEGDESVVIFNKQRFASRLRDVGIARNWLINEFDTNKMQNIIVSPLSFYEAAVLLANGVVDETLIEFSNLFSVLKLSDVGLSLHNYLSQKEESIFINLSLWGSVFTEKYGKMMEQQLNAEVWGIKDSTASVNDWAKARTQGVIEKIAPVESVAKDELFIGSIAFYKNSMKIPFAAHDNLFHAFDGKNIQTTVLSAKHEVNYFEDDEKQAIQIECNHNDFITILLPRENVDFKDFVKDLTMYNLLPEFDKHAVVDISLPVIDFEYNAKATGKVFESFNINRIFTQQNNEFAKMVSFDDEVYVKNLYMHAKVNISADNDADMTEDFSKLKAKYTFNANRPFVFIINHGDFIGTFVQPSIKQSL